ncbi:hypothetical protein ANCDUO_16915, partial [Ancylostoma duodenale]
MLENCSRSLSRNWRSSEGPELDDPLGQSDRIPAIIPNIIAVYNQTNPTAQPSFDYIINSQYYNTSNFSILLYSGDVDTMCNWMGAEWFTTQYFNGTLGLGVSFRGYVENCSVATPLLQLPPRQPWSYQTGPLFYATLGGYARRYTRNIDVLTVKGSGHLVPLDRPAQALQMIYNWINKQDYSTPFMQTPTSTSTPATTTPLPSTSGPARTSGPASSTASSTPAKGGSTITVPSSPATSPYSTVSSSMETTVGSTSVPNRLSTAQTTSATEQPTT